MSDGDPQPVSVGSQFGRYRLKRLLGHGGMGQVFEADDTGMDRVVALKVITGPLAQDPEFKKRLQREARIAGRLQDPHVVPIHGTGEIDGQLYVDMRLIDGTDLHTVLKASGPMAPARAVAIVRQIASALDAAHAAGVIHRDVKPANILLTSDDFAYLVDFGIANAVTEERLTHIGDVLGTWTYMAPERFVGDSDTISHSVDTYALACVLYEMLTGSPPYQGDHANVMGGHLTKPIPRASTLRAAIPEALDEVISRGMAKNPDDRYPSAGELARAAAAAVPAAGGDDQTAPTRTSGPHALVTDVIRGPGSSPGQPQKPTGTAKFVAARRHWKTLAAAVVVIIAAAGVGIWAMTRPGPVSQTPAQSYVAPTPTPTGAPTTSPPAKNFTPADVDLLKVMPSVGYNRDNCSHTNASMGADAVLSCDKNPIVGAPTARFFHFPTTDALTDTYKTNLVIFHTTACPGSTGPPGPDDTMSVGGTKVGRDACYSDNTVNPPAPSMIIENDNPPVLEIFNWTDPGGMDALRAWFKAGGAKVQNAPGVNPDFYTQADLDLLKQLDGTPYSKANCRHVDPPPPMKATLGCVYNLTAGAPNAGWFGFPNRDVTQTWYDNMVKQLAPHRCGGAPGGSDDAWLNRDGKHLGRYTCFADPTQNKLPALLAADTEAAFAGAQFTAEPASSPYQLPKSEQELSNWFNKRFNG